MLAQSNVEVFLAQCSEETIGFALFFENFSTFLGKPAEFQSIPQVLSGRGP
jgi:hypothetical protein